MTAISAEEREVKINMRHKTSMPLLWIGIMSIVMLFAALTSAVVVSKGSRDWVTFSLPSTFLVSTIVILLSSFTYWYAYRSAKKNNLNGLKNGVLLTLILGIFFALLQFISWGQLTGQGIYFAGSSSTVSGSYLYTLSGLHLAHLLGGIISLIVVYVKSRRSLYNSDNLLGLQLSSTYWHFLDGLWVYLYIFLNFIAL
jgi:cytochrome c oxidase subunit 3